MEENIMLKWSTKKANVLNVLPNVLNVDYLTMKLLVSKITVSMDTMKYKMIAEQSHVLVVKDPNKI
jgi:hypothetical protein